MNENNTLYIVVPCYKEQEVLPETSKRLKEKVLALRAQGKISDKSRIMFVNDGSSDNTCRSSASFTSRSRTSSPA